jgi:hypothetical protein
MDPKAEEYRKWGTYNYCLDNPLRFVDPDGMGPGDSIFWNMFMGWWDKIVSGANSLNEGAQQQAAVASGNAGYQNENVPQNVQDKLNTSNNVQAAGKIAQGVANIVEGSAEGVATVASTVVPPLLATKAPAAGVAAARTTAEVGAELMGTATKGGSAEVKLLGTVRDNLLNTVENPKLRNIVNDLFRPNAKVGSGSSMDAFRLEQQTGVAVGGKMHTTKLLNYRTALQRVWNNRDNLSAGDRQITKQLLGDIQNALSGH